MPKRELGIVYDASSKNLSHPSETFYETEDFDQTKYIFQITLQNEPENSKWWWNISNKCNEGKIKS